MTAAGCPSPTLAFSSLNGKRVRPRLDAESAASDKHSHFHSDLCINGERCHGSLRLCHAAVTEHSAVFYSAPGAAARRLGLIRGPGSAGVVPVLRPDSSSCFQQISSWRDPCEAKPCENEAPCHSMEQDFYCACPEGFEGKRCERLRESCRSPPCQGDPPPKHTPSPLMALR